MHYPPTPLIQGLTAFQAILTVLSVVAVGLRFWSRAVTTGAGFGLDDWLALLSLILTLVIFGLTFDAIEHGIGQHISVISPDDLNHLFIKSLFPALPIFQIFLAIPKLSALAFYDRVFDFRRTGSRTWKWTIYGLEVAIVLWAIGSLPPSIYQCVPPAASAAFPHLPGGRCVPFFTPLAVNTGLDAFFDVLVLLVPLPALRKLHISRSKKALLFGTFILGYSIPVLSVGRTIVTVKIGSDLVVDFTHAFIYSQFWSAANVGMANVVISLPAIFHLGVRAWTLGPRSVFKRSDGTASYERGYRRSRKNGSFRRLNRRSWPTDPRTNDSTLDTVNFASASTVSNVGAEVPLESIYVKTDVHVGKEDRDAIGAVARPKVQV